MLSRDQAAFATAIPGVGLRPLVALLLTGETDHAVKDAEADVGVSELPLTLRSATATGVEQGHRSFLPVHAHQPPSPPQGASVLVYGKPRTYQEALPCNKQFVTPCADFVRPATAAADHARATRIKRVRWFPRRSRSRCYTP